MECLICHQKFVPGDRTVMVDAISETGVMMMTGDAVHLHHLNQIPAVGGGTPGGSL